MSNHRLRRLALAAGASASAAALAGATAAPALAGTSPSAAASHRHVIATVPAWTAAAPKVANLPAGRDVTAKVWLAPRDAAGLQALAAAVSDPRSSQFRHFLTAADYRTRFAPTAGTVAAVEAWLSGAGLRVTGVGADNHFVDVDGTAAAVRQAFGAQLATFTVNGSTEQAPTTAVSVPAGVAGSVVAVTGLDTLNHAVRPQNYPPPAGFVNATPCSAYYGQKLATDLPQFHGQTLPYAVCGYVPSQLRSTYGVTATGLTGAGVTVAITDAYDASTLESDANTYATNHGDQAFAPGQFKDVSDRAYRHGRACGGNGWFGEQALDVEAVHGMAPAAGVMYYGARSCFDDDLMASLARVVSDNKASIVTNSWGEPTFVVIKGKVYSTITQALVNAYEGIFLQGAVQGIGFYFSSGDSGDEFAATGIAHPDWPTGDPLVTSVGGTALATGASGSRIFETGWGTEKYSLTPSGTAWTQTIPFQYGAGGGFSQVFAEPWYQKGVVHYPAGVSHGRAVPDVAMDADPTTGMRVGETQTFPNGVHYGEYRIGGTSLASPLMAGAQADAQSALDGQRIGFANPLIYFLAKTVKPFYDVRGPGSDPGNVRVDFVNGLDASAGLVDSVRTFDQDSSLTVHRGWDDVTGVGTVTAAYLRLFARG